MMLGGEISTTLTGRVVDIDHSRQRPHPADHRRHRHRKADTALRAAARARLGADGCRRPAGWARSCRASCACSRRPDRSGRAATTFPSRAISTASARPASSCADPSFCRRPGLSRIGRPSLNQSSNARAGDRRPYPRPHRRRGGRDRRGADGRRARRHSRRRQRGAAPGRPLPHHLDLRPAHGAGRRRRHGRVCAPSSRCFRALPSRHPVKKIAAFGAIARHRRLSLHLRRRGGGRSAASSCSPSC